MSSFQWPGCTTLSLARRCVNSNCNGHKWYWTVMASIRLTGSLAVPWALDRGSSHTLLCAAPPPTRDTRLRGSRHIPREQSPFGWLICTLPALGISSLLSQTRQADRLSVGRSCGRPLSPIINLPFPPSVQVLDVTHLTITLLSCLLLSSPTHDVYTLLFVVHLDLPYAHCLPPPSNRLLLLQLGLPFQRHHGH